MRRIHADLMLLLAAAIWGVAFVFQKSAMDHIGPNAFIAARGFLAALTLVPFAIHEARRTATPPPIKLMQIAGIAGIAFFLGALFQQLGLQTATVSNTGFLTGLYVIITPFIAWGWIGQRPTLVVWAAVALSFVGTWLLGGGTLDGFNRGDGFVAICALYWAIHITIVGYSSRYNRPVLFTAIQFAVVGLLGLFGALVTETTTMSGLDRSLAVDRLRRGAVERIDLHVAGDGDEAHDDGGGDHHRQPRNGHRRDRRRIDAWRTAVVAGDGWSRAHSGRDHSCAAGGAETTPWSRRRHDHDDISAPQTTAAPRSPSCWCCSPCSPSR